MLGEFGAWCEEDVLFVGTAYKIDAKVKKGHPIELRTIWVHSEDEIPKIDFPTENADSHGHGIEERASDCKTCWPDDDATPGAGG